MAQKIINSQRSILPLHTERCNANYSTIFFFLPCQILKKQKWKWSWRKTNSILKCKIICYCYYFFSRRTLGSVVVLTCHQILTQLFILSNFSPHLWIKIYNEKQKHINFSWASNNTVLMTGLYYYYFVCVCVLIVCCRHAFQAWARLFRAIKNKTFPPWLTQPRHRHRDTARVPWPEATLEQETASEWELPARSLSADQGRAKGEEPQACLPPNEPMRAALHQADNVIHPTNGHLSGSTTSRQPMGGREGEEWRDGRNTNLSFWCCRSKVTYER